jgi:hypothetical protein
MSIVIGNMPISERVASLSPSSAVTLPQSEANHRTDPYRGAGIRSTARTRMDGESQRRVVPQIGLFHLTPRCSGRRAIGCRQKICRREADSCFNRLGALGHRPTLNNAPAGFPESRFGASRGGADALIALALSGAGGISENRDRPRLRPPPTFRVSARGLAICWEFSCSRLGLK